MTRQDALHLTADGIGVGSGRELDADALGSILVSVQLCGGYSLDGEQIIAQRISQIPPRSAPSPV